MSRKLLFALFGTLLTAIASSLLSEEVVGNYFQNLTFVDIYTNENKDPELSDEPLLIAEQERQERKKMSLTRSDQIPSGRLQEETASYIEGYIQALIDANYYELNVLVFVDKNRTVYLYNLPNDDRVKESIKAFVQDVPDIEDVQEGLITPEMQHRIEERQGGIRQVGGVWFPESTVLFPPLIANPREPVYSVAYRWFDKVLAKNVIAVSLGDIFPIFRWFHLFPPKGDLQIDIAACVWADFDMKPENTPNHEWAELLNTDYLLSIPVSYALDKWAFRLKFYHISSHLGDEFMCNQPEVKRVNPSFEAIELMGSYQFTEGIRVYLGPGFIVHSDRSYPMDWFYAEGGAEIRFYGHRLQYHRLYGAPFFAVDLQIWQVNNFRPSATLQLGYEWSKLRGAGRKVRIFLEYHNGNSAGQFFAETSQYLGIRGSWGF